MPTHALALLAVSATIGVPANDHPDRHEATIDELRATVAQLQMQVDQLRAQSDDNWLTQQRADEIRGLVQEVLADADTRASLLQSGAAAGYDRGFFLGSTDGNFLLKFSGQMQFRFVYNNREESGTDEGDRWGFENRRTKLYFQGHVIDPSWQYRVSGGFERDGGGFVLEDAYINKTFDNGMELRFGQFKAPFLREDLVSSSRQLAVERSLIDGEFKQDRVQGVELSWEGDSFRWAAMVSDGFFPGGSGTMNTPWQAEDTEYAFTGRVEFLASGDWKTFNDFTSFRGQDPGVMIGAAAHYQNGEFGTPSVETEFLGLTADVSIEFGGANLFGAIVYRSLDDDAGTDLDQWGFVVQGGVFLTDDWEIFARYEFGDSDDGAEDLSVATVGVNKYFASHALKWTTDVGYGFNEVASIWSSSGAGWRTDAPDDDGQIVFRSQFQLLF